jgi:hypothetical protein
MKKMGMLIVLAFVLLAGNETQAGVADKILLYLPNRIVDLTDIFSISLGFGPVVRAEARVTRYCDIGAGIGISAKIIKGANRQYGGGLQNGWDASFLCIAAEDTELESGSRWLKSYWYHSSGIPSPSEKIYNFYTGERDFWEIGVNGAALVELDAALHPVEIADFITGWFFIDLKGDDFTAEDLDY